MSETGEQMKKRRKQLNMSADELAEKLGVSRSTNFINCDQQIEFRKLRKYL